METPTLEQFERTLKDYGRGLAPNGCYYTLIERGENRLASVDRTFQDRTKPIVGFNGNRFDNPTAAMMWAIADGRCEMIEDLPLFERKLIA